MIKFIRIKFLRYFRNLKQSLGGLFNYILNFFSISYPKLLDSFFLGSIGLLFFRFFFRLFFFSNPFWFFNFSIYIFCIFLEFKYSLLNKIKEIFITIAKILLGKNYWYQYSTSERLEFHFIKQQEVPIMNITQAYVFNKIFQHVFVLLILVRLYSFAFPIKFFLLNFIVTFLLVFNNYLLFASFVSFIIIFSRLYIYSSDNDKNKLFFIINRIEKLNSTEYIIPNWKNAKIISLIVTRTYFNRKFYSLNMEKEYSIPLLLLDVNLNRFIYKRFLQITSNFSDTSSYPISYHFRMGSHLTYLQTDGEFGNRYIEILQKKKRKNSHYFPFSSFIAFVPFQFSDKIIWLKNATKTNFLDFSLPYYKQRAKGHPEIFGFFNGYILRSNETTIKNGNDRTGLGIHPILGPNQMATGFGNTKTVTAFEPPDYIIDLLWFIKKEKNNKNLTELTVSNDFIPNIHAWERLMQLKQILSCEAFFDMLTERNGFVLPEPFNCVTMFLNPLASKQQIQEGFDVALTYLNLMVKSKHNTIQQLNDYLVLLEQIKQIKKDLTHFYPELGADKENCIIGQIKIDIMKQINFVLKQNPEKPPFNVIKKVIKEFFGDTQYTVVSHISNIHNIARNLGGEDKKKILYKDIHAEKPFIQPVRASTDVVVYKSKMNNDDYPVE